MTPILPELNDTEAIDQITAYLRGELHSSDKAAVEHRRKTDPAFDELFIAHVKLAAASRLSNLESKREMLKEHAASQPRVAVQPLSSKPQIMRYTVAAIILLLVAVGVWTMIPQKPDQLFLAHFSNSIIPGKGVLSEMQPEDQKAHDYYNREQYAKAAKEFDKLVKVNPEENLPYAAASHLGAGHVKKASALLDLSLEKVPGNKPQIILLQALVFVRQGEYGAARQLLDANRSIIEGHKDIETLYNDLESLE